MDLLGLQNSVTQMQKLLDDQQAKILQLESQTARDVNVIVDKVLAGVMPRVDAAAAEVQGVREAVELMTTTISAAVTEALGVVRRLNGASVTMQLGPEDTMGGVEVPAGAVVTHG